MLKESCPSRPSEWKTCIRREKAVCSGVIQFNRVSQPALVCCLGRPRSRAFGNRPSGHGLSLCTLLWEELYYRIHPLLYMTVQISWKMEEIRDWPRSRLSAEPPGGVRTHPPPHSVSLSHKSKLGCLALTTSSAMRGDRSTIASRASISNHPHPTGDISLR